MRILPLLTITVLFSFLISCQKDELQLNEGTTLNEDVVAFTVDDWNEEKINVDTSTNNLILDKKVFRKYKVEEGDILLSTKGGGYLRKVKTIVEDGDQRVIETEFAAITEAFSELHESASSHLMPNTESPDFWLDEGVQLNQNKSVTENLIDISINNVLFDADNSLVTTNDQVRISGNYKLDADFFVNFDVSLVEIDELVLQYDIKQTKTIEGYMGAGISLKKEKCLSKIPCGMITAGLVVIEPVVEIYAGFNVNLSAALETKLEQSYNSFTKLSFEDGQWNTEKTVTEDERFEEPDIEGALNARLYIRPELKFKVYRTVSPYIEAEIYGKTQASINSELLSWDASVGFDFNAGVDMMIWNKTVFDYNTNIFNWDHSISSGEKYLPTYLYNTTWDFLIKTINNASWHANVTFYPDGTTKYDEPDLLGVYTTYGTWNLEGKTLTYDMDSSDPNNQTYQFTGIVSGNTMVGKYTFSPFPDQEWSAVKIN